jgi:phosphoribosylanthranilate isomerase
MGPTARPRFKVCCIRSLEEARLAIDAGASAIGLVSRMPSGPGVVDDDTIAEIAARVPPGVDSFLLTSRQDPGAIAEQHRHARTSVLQLVDALEPEARRTLRQQLPGVRVAQVIHVTGPESVDEAREAAETSDAILLDSGNPSLQTKQLGGTGRRHDWAISARIREALDVPVMLAGGLNHDNAGEAIAAVRPWALDVCSGLRDAESSLVSSRLRRFAEAVRSSAG